MKLTINQRLIGLGLAVVLMGAAIVVLILNTEREATLTRSQLRAMDVESFQIADRFRDKLRLANDYLRRYASTDDRTAWDEFVQASRELKAWIEQQDRKGNSEAEQAACRELESGYGLYMQRANELHTGLENSHETGASLAQYNSFFEQSRHLNDLGENLARADFGYRNQVLAHASRALAQLRLLVIGSLVLLFVFGLALAGVVSRDLIGPLRTQLVESQATAERNEKLASLGVLAAGVAHEIRNPLTALKTALFLQQRKTGPGALAAGENELVEREILRLERIVNEFLEFARPAPPRPVIVPAVEPLQQVHALLGPELALANIRLVHEPGEALSLRADAAQIQQVLINLVQNAADSIGRNGTITLRARADHKSLANGETEVVVLEVSDTGKGIAPEVQKRLFDPFFTTKEKGMGLGLSIAARMIEMNGGVLQFQTQVNHGSTFSIVLPRADQPRASTKE